MKKILFLTEASFLSTGYSTYGREIMKRLYSTGKYKIAELGCYGHVAPLQNEIDNYIRLFGPPRMFDIPWTYYGNLPSESKEENDLYNSNMTNQYGEWRFERTCLDFQPDVVCDFRDFWMHEYVLRSPLRRFFKFAVMPTVDSAPLQEQWLYAYSSADAVFSYSEFGKQTLLDGTNNNINFRGIASPSADKEIFKPVKDKFNHRSMMGFEDDIKIIGTVMRNQGRKLYPDLFEVFSKISKEVPNCYLYCHTCYPDIGWDIPYFLKYFDIGNKVLFTYKCFECGAIIPSFFSDSVKTCPHCNNISCKMPNTQNGISPVDLAAIYNCFDIYIQYSNCEGYGIPQCEAAFCGVPVAAVDYSAMSSILNDIDGIRLPVQRMFWDTGTNAQRALPDNNKAADIITEHLKMPVFSLLKMGNSQRIKALQAYDYDKSAKLWSDYFDSVVPSNWNDKNANIQEPELDKIPSNIPNNEFVNWCLVKILKEPERINSYEAMKWLKDLNYGEAIKGTSEIIFNEASFITNNQRYMSFTRKDFINNLLRIAEKRNYYEKLRLGLINEPQPYWIIRKKEGV